jgi:hypothetical protein
VSSNLPPADFRNISLVFPATYEAMRPFFDPATRWGNSGQEHLAFRTLADHFPELSAQDRFLIVITAKRLFQGG